MNTKLLVDRFLSWPLPESLCSDPCASMPGYPHRTGTNLMTAEQAEAMIEYVIAAPRQPEGEEIAWSLRSEVAGCGLVHYMTDSKYQAQTPAIKQWYEPFRCQQCSDAQRTIAELREEYERLRVKLMTIASAEPGRHNIEWAKAMAATGNNEAYAKWREAFDQRDKLEGLLREVRVIVAREVERWTRASEILPVNARVESSLLQRIDAVLAEVKPCASSHHPAVD